MDITFFVSWWTFGLFLYFGYCELCFFEHICTVYFSWVYTQEWNFWLYSNSMFNILKNCQTVFQVVCIIFLFWPAIYESSDFSIYLAIVVLLIIIILVFKWYLTMINDAEPLSMCLLALCVSCRDGGEMFIQILYSF